MVADVGTWLDRYDGPGFDLAFVDCRPGKFHRRADLLGYLVAGALYVGDDLLPQPTWPDVHQPRVDTFVSELNAHSGLHTTLMTWPSGLVVAARI